MEEWDLNGCEWIKMGLNGIECENVRTGAWENGEMGEWDLNGFEWI